MNSDRLISVPAASIAAGLNTKWNNYCPFLGITWTFENVNNGTLFENLKTNADVIEIACFLEPEDLWYLLFQSKSGYVCATKGSISIPMTDDNIKAIFIYKWKRAITQLPNTSIELVNNNGDNITFSFLTTVNNSPISLNKELYKTKVILTGYLDGYFNEVSSNVAYPNVYTTYVIDWDKIRARFNYRMETSL